MGVAGTFRGRVVGFLDLGTGVLVPKGKGDGDLIVSEI